MSQAYTITELHKDVIAEIIVPLFDSVTLRSFALISKLGYSIISDAAKLLQKEDVKPSFEFIGRLDWIQPIGKTDEKRIQSLYRIKIRSEKFKNPDLLTSLNQAIRGFIELQDTQEEWRDDPTKLGESLLYLEALRESLPTLKNPAPDQFVLANNTINEIELTWDPHAGASLFECAYRRCLKKLSRDNIQQLLSVIVFDYSEQKLTGEDLSKVLKAIRNGTRKGTEELAKAVMIHPNWSAKTTASAQTLENVS